MNSIIPPGSMVVGSPGRILRILSPEEQAGLGSWADHYLILAEEYKKRGIVHPAYSGVSGKKEGCVDAGSEPYLSSEHEGSTSH